MILFEYDIFLFLFVAYKLVLLPSLLGGIKARVCGFNFVRKWQQSRFSTYIQDT